MNIGEQQEIMDQVFGERGFTRALYDATSAGSFNGKSISSLLQDTEASRILMGPHLGRISLVLERPRFTPQQLFLEDKRLPLYRVETRYLGFNEYIDFAHSEAHVVSNPHYLVEKGFRFVGGN